MPDLTFYGHFTGWSSYPIVSSSLVKWLRARGVDVECVDLRTDVDVLAAAAAITAGRLERNTIKRTGAAMVFGFPEWLHAIPQHDRIVGYHVCDVDTVPPHWVAAMNRIAHYIFTPSRWCRSVFERCGVVTPVSVVPHGLDPEVFTPDTDAKLPQIFTFRHFSSSSGDRKGTQETRSAFGLADVNYGSSCLVIHGADTDPLSPLEQAARYRRSHVIVAPSRAEGYGMCPCEALACGVPVVTTRATGHAEWFPEGGLPGTVLVETGEMTPCLPGEGWAPSLNISSLRRAIEKAHGDWPALRAEALDNSEYIRERFSWDNQLSRSSLLDVLASIM